MTEFFATPYSEVEMLTTRPLLAIERLARRLENRVRFEEQLAELMEDAPLKADAEVVRRPKAKRRKPAPSPLVLRSVGGAG